VRGRELSSSPNRKLRSVSDSGRGWFEQVVADARQGIVGNLAYFLAVGALAAVIALAGGTVPAWTLPAGGLLATIVAALLVAGQVRRRARVEGQLDSARGRISDLEAAVANQHEQLAAVTAGESPLTGEPRAFMRRINALRLTGTSRSWTEDRPVISETTQDLVQTLITNMRQTYGWGDQVLETASKRMADDAVTVQDLAVTLGQLEALIQNSADL
jgi:hypothetical protein